MATPFGSLSGLHLPSFSTNLGSTASLQDAMVTATTPRGSSQYMLTTEPPQVVASAQVSASGQVAASCSCRLLSHQTLVSGLPRSLPPLPPSPAPPCLPCVKGRQRAAPHSSSFPLTSAPLQTLHMDDWGPARDLPVLRVHSDRGGQFSSNLLREFCRGEGIFLSFTLPDSPQQNGIAERRIGLVMETSPTLHWTGKVGDASVFRVKGSRAFICDTSADKLSPRAIPCVLLGFVPDAPGWQFYHPTSRCVLSSQDVTFHELIPFYRLFPYRSTPPLPPPLFLAPDPLPGPVPVQVAVSSGAAPGAASGGAGSEGAEPGGAGSEGAETGGAEPGGVGTGVAEPEGVEPGGAASEGAESGGAKPQGATLS
ncbi:unnamed protein product [Closterium sp. NIES-53]